MEHSAPAIQPPLSRLRPTARSLRKNRGCQFDGHGQRAAPSLSRENRLYAKFFPQTSRGWAKTRKALDGGGTVLHCDVMDGHFVPNITDWTAGRRQSLRKSSSNAILDCHLMIEHADEFIPHLRKPAQAWISVHQEALRSSSSHVAAHCKRTHGCKPAVVINPATLVHRRSMKSGYGTSTFW